VPNSALPVDSGDRKGIQPTKKTLANYPKDACLEEIEGENQRNNQLIQLYLAFKMMLLHSM